MKALENVQLPIPGDLVEVGHVSGAYGIRGWVRVHPYSAEAEALLPHLVRVYVPIASVFVDIDTEYIAILRYGRPLSAEEQEKYDMEVTETTRRCNFVAGSVPESIKNKLK